MTVFTALALAKAVCMSVVFSEEKIIKIEELKTALDASLLNNKRMTKINRDELGVLQKHKRFLYESKI